MEVSVGDLWKLIKAEFPIQMQESYDNSGFLCGNIDDKINGVLLCLDSTEAVIDEAIQKKCNVVIAHHPFIFKGLKSVTGKTWQERTLIKAIQNRINIFALHTNLDNHFWGVNRKFAEKLGLQNISILQSIKGVSYKLVSYVPSSHVEQVLQAVFNAGAGKIGNYDECSFQINGIGTFKPNNDAKPFVGELNKRHLEAETRIEVWVDEYKKPAVIAALLKAHPYEEVAWDLIPIANKHPEVGAGMIGDLPETMEMHDFLHFLKNRMEITHLRFSGSKKEIKKVALCGGAGVFLASDAVAKGADIFISGDIKYHDFLDTDRGMILCDIGHYESEKFTKELLSEWIMKKFTTFAVLLSEINTNPITYF